uniref:Very-long-chain (3R)-3-hydroxyacyl-CoA dehydratase n=1 Tax=Corethrella appendiculata TaxID=1370023 RepID=U5ENU0_9DIPT
MTLKLCPFVYWAQNESIITLKVDLKEVKSPKISLKSNEITFSGYGLGAQGLHEYNFNLNFYCDIDTDGSSYKVVDSKVDFIIKKAEKNWWPRLISQPQKPHWLKIDFDRWRSEDDLDLDDDDKEAMARDITKDYPDMYDKLHKQEYGYRKEQGKKVYLILYNMLQFVGYLYILLVMGVRYSRDGPESMRGTYETVGNAFKFCQLLQYLEVMHPLFGYTKGGVLMPFIQVSGRAFILFAMIDYEERMQTKPVVFYLFFIWALIEIVRYPYYLTQLVNINFSILTWLRYTIWIPLYPLGIMCESIIVLRNIPYFEETKRFTIEMPNSYNFTFHMPTFMKIYLLVLILPGMYFMMNHMSKTRSNKLGPKKWKKSC